MEGYVELEMEGQKIGLKFGMDCLKHVQEKSRTMLLVDAKGAVNDAGLAYILYYGYKNWCLVKELTPSLTYESFFNFAEAAYYDKERNEECVKLITAFAESKIVKSEVSKKTEEPEKVKKKKQISRK